MAVPGPVEAFGPKFRRYLREVEVANSEPTRSFLFLSLLKEEFAGIDADHVERLVPQLERYVRVSGSSVLVRSGRIDALLGNLIFEFKIALDHARLETAKEELCKYVAALWTEEGSSRRSYLAISTDGVSFQVFRPRTAKADGVVTSEEVTLEPIDSLSFSRVEPEVAFKWLDRYVLYRERIPPNTEDMAKDFGLNSTTFKLVTDRLKEAWSQGRSEAHAPFEEWQRYLSLVYGSLQGDDDLFLRHTYLATLAKLMVHVYYSGGAIPASPDELDRILSGRAFREWGIENFLEEDFFSWLIRGRAKTRGLAAAWLLLQALERYDMERLNEDVLKGLYQELVDPKDRHDLGEYYTPDWLAEWIVRELGIGVDQRVLDPACGSGTFLVAVVRQKRENGNKTGLEALGTILTTVMGIDVHPLAVLVAKANYLMALGDLIRLPKMAKVQVPIYLANSIVFPEAQPDVVHSVAVYRYPIDDKASLAIPAAVVESESVSAAIDAVEEYARSVALKAKPLAREPFWDYVKRRMPETTAPGAIETLFETTGTLSKLIQDNRNTIYAFLIKNVYKPAILGRFDFVVGNPPWLSYRYVRLPKYQDSLKAMVTDQYHLLERRETKLLTHMELATLFVARCADVFVVDGGRIGFVMPRSLFTSNQHEAFRRGGFEPHLRFEQVWDLSAVEPLFNVPSCVVVGQKGGPFGLPKTATTVTGKLPVRNAPYAVFESLRASGAVQVAHPRLDVITLGSLTVWSVAEPSETRRPLRQGPSPYRDRFRQGATIVPRTAWFVSLKAHPRFGFDTREPFVESSKRALAQAKKDYAAVRGSGRVEAEYLFATITGSEILPFCHLPLPVVVLPAEPHQGRYRMLKRGEIESRGHVDMAKWLAQMEEAWRSIRGPKSEKMDIYQRLDRGHGITSQSSTQGFYVVYNSAGTYLNSCVLAVPADLSARVNAHEIQLRGLVVEHKAYVSFTESREEADYLCGLLNSERLDELVRPMQSRGSFGPRDIEKKPFELAIPRFDSADPAHRTIAAQARECVSRVGANLAGMIAAIGADPESFGPNALGRLRTQIRASVDGELRAVDTLVERLLYQ